MQAINTMSLSRSGLPWFPCEIVMNIFGYLKPRELAQAAQVCRMWRFVADKAMIPFWQKVKDANELEEQEGSVLKKYSFWFSTQRNFAEGRITAFFSFATSAPEEGIDPAGYFSEKAQAYMLQKQILMSGSGEGVIKKWNVETGRCEHVHRGLGYLRNIASLASVGSFVFSAGQNELVPQMWDVESGRVLRHFQGHTSPVNILQVHEGSLFTASYDLTVKMWDIQTGVCLQTFSGHTQSLYCLIAHQGFLFTGSSDSTAKMWDIATGKQKTTFYGTDGSGVTCLGLQAESLFTGSVEGAVWQHDISSTIKPFSFKGHQGSITCFAFREQTLFVGTDKGMIRIWDLNTKSTLQDFDMKDSVKRLLTPTCGPRFLIVGSNRSFRILDLDKKIVTYDETFQDDLAVLLTEIQSGKLIVGTKVKVSVFDFRPQKV